MSLPSSQVKPSMSEAKPFVFHPSGKWDGNDGKWSSFFVNVGASGNNIKRGQEFRVLISTANSFTSIPWPLSQCNDTCSSNRGVEAYKGLPSSGFQTSESGGWKEDESAMTRPLPPYTAKEELIGTVGYDTVGVGRDDPASLQLTQQVVFGLQQTNSFLGSFGLSKNPVQFTSYPMEPFLKVLKGARENRIPSISYGYAAGAWYRNLPEGSFGSLVLGGYDGSRRKGQGITLRTAYDSSLTVAVQDINIYSDSSGAQPVASLSETSKFYATIDSTFPYLWLPYQVCDEFERAFGLTFDNNTELYTIDKTAQEKNQKDKTRVIIKLGEALEDGNQNYVPIELPYSAFDQIAKWPIYSNDTNYFPIRRTDGPFVLGRAFLQEAYLTVDHESKNFSVHQVFHSGRTSSPENIVTIPSQNQTSSGGRHSLKSSAIAGIAVSLAVIIIITIGIIFYWHRSKCQSKKGRHKVGDQTISELPEKFRFGHIRRPSELEDAKSSPQMVVDGYFGPDNITRLVEMPSPPPKQGDFDPQSTPAELYDHYSPGLTSLHELPADEATAEKETRLVSSTTDLGPQISNIIPLQLPRVGTRNAAAYENGQNKPDN